MAGGVFYREFTKLFDFTGKTTLGVIHGHLLVLGTFFFLLLAVLCKFTSLGDQKLFQKFFLIYNIALPFDSFYFPFFAEDMLNEICSLEVRSHSLKGVLGERAREAVGRLKNGRESSAKKGK